MSLLALLLVAVRWLEGGVVPLSFLLQAVVKSLPPPLCLEDCSRGRLQTLIAKLSSHSSLYLLRPQLPALTCIPPALFCRGLLGMDSPHKTKSQKYISLPVLEQESLVTILELESALINFRFPLFGL